MNHRKLTHQTLEAINSELNYQDREWKEFNNRGHDLPSWISIMRHYLDEAEKEWRKNSLYDTNYPTVTDNIRKVIATGISALFQWKVRSR